MNRVAESISAAWRLDIIAPKKRRIVGDFSCADLTDLGIKPQAIRTDNFHLNGKQFNLVKVIKHIL